MSCDVTCDMTLLCDFVMLPVIVCDKLSHTNNRKEKKRNNKYKLSWSVVSQLLSRN